MPDPAMTRPCFSLRRFARDRRGVSAIEFAMIAPLLITFYLGMAETTQAMMAKRKASHVASAIGDLVAQDQSLTNAEMADTWTIGNALLSPYPTTGRLKMRVTSVTANASGVAKVDWSDNSGWTDVTDGSTWTGIPAGLITAGQSLIIAETTYAYDSPIKKYVPNTTDFARTYYLRPRKINTVLRDTTS
jgi:Flp pilus assembly protein TadG